MILRLQTKTNKNGYSYQLEINTQNKTFKAGYFIFRSPDIKGLTYTQINAFKQVLIQAGFAEVE